MARAVSEQAAVSGPRHAVALYESRDDLGRRALPFLRDGLVAGERVVVIVSADAAEPLRDGLGSDHRHVLWDLPSVSYVSLGGAFSGLRGYFAEQYEAGNRIRLIAENPTVGDASRTAAYLRFEAAANDVLGEFGFAWACLYDRRQYSAEVLDQVAQVHPLLLDRHGGMAESRLYRPPDSYLQANPGPLSPVPRAVAVDTWLTTGAELPAARRTIVETAARLELPVDDLEDFELAAAEVMSNAIRHGEQPCRLRLWDTPTHVVLRVDDQGPGDDIPTKGFRPPDPGRGQYGGMGMWIIRQVADSVHVETGGAGTAVEVQFHRHRSRPPVAPRPGGPGL